MYICITYGCGVRCPSRFAEWGCSYSRRMRKNPPWRYTPYDNKGGVEGGRFTL